MLAEYFFGCLVWEHFPEKSPFFFLVGGAGVAFLKVKKLPKLRAGGRGRGNLDNAQKKGRFFSGKFSLDWLVG